MTKMPTSVSAALGKSCWSCQGLVTNEPFCPTCQVIQPPDPALDYFQLFGLPMAFPLDMARLEQLYQSLQRHYHPDRFAARGATERRFSLEHVTRLNQAYQTLRDPLARSNYLLARIAGPDFLTASQEAMDAEFLLEVMEDREALEAVNLSAGDAGQRLERLRGQAMARIEQEEAALHRLFAVVIATPAPASLQQIAQINHRLRYHHRFLEAVDQAEERMI